MNCLISSNFHGKQITFSLQIFLERISIESSKKSKSIKINACSNKHWSKIEINKLFHYSNKIFTVNCFKTENKRKCWRFSHFRCVQKNTIFHWLWGKFSGKITGLFLLKILWILLRWKYCINHTKNIQWKCFAYVFI